MYIILFGHINVLEIILVSQEFDSVSIRKEWHSVQKREKKSTYQNEKNKKNMPIVAHSDRYAQTKLNTAATTGSMTCACVQRTNERLYMSESNSSVLSVEAYFLFTLDGGLKSSDSSCKMTRYTSTSHLIYRSIC